MVLENAEKRPNHYYKFVHVVHVVVDIIRSATTANQKPTKSIIAHMPTFCFTSSFLILCKIAAQYITQFKNLLPKKKKD